MSGRIKAARAGYSGDADYATRRAMPGIGYRGDPGLFGFVGKLIKGGLRGATSLATGGGVTGALRGFRSAFQAGRGVSARRQRMMQQQLAQIPGGTPVNLPMAITTGQPPAATFNIERTQGIRGEIGPGGRPGPARGKGTMIMAGPGGSCPTGYKPNKTGYWITSPQGTPSYVSPGERCVKIRKRNPLNPRAWDRAYGRLKSSKRWQKKIAAVTFREKC